MDHIVVDASLRPEERLGRELRAAREANRLSLRELARRLHRSHSNLWDYERGHRFAPREIVLEYVAELGVAPGPLLDHWERARFELFGEDRARRRPFVATGTVLDLRTEESTGEGRRTDPGTVDAADGAGAGRAGVTFRLLGPLEVEGDGGPLDLAAPAGAPHLPAALLTALLVEVNRPVGLPDLAARIRHGQASTDRDRAAVRQAAGHLQHVLQALPPNAARLSVDDSMCMLSADPSCLDTEQFRRAVEDGIRLLEDARWEEASERLARGLSLWRGAPFGDMHDQPWAHAEVVRLEELRLTATEGLGRAWLELGMHARVVAEHLPLVEVHPLREELRAQLMLALYRSRRQAEALRTYEDLQDRLAQEVGVAPGREVAALAQAIRRHDPALDWPQVPGPSLPALGTSPSAPMSSPPALGGPPTGQARRGPARRPPDPGFVGRLDVLRRFDGWLDEARGGEHRVVTVWGEPGIGKSRLAAQVVARADQQGCALLLGTCQEQGAVPYLPIATALAPILDVTGTALLGADPAGAGGAGWDLPAADRQRLGLFLAAADALTGALDRQPVVLVIEDLHWADEPTVALLEHLLADVGLRAAVRPVPLLTILTVRPGPLAPPVASLVEKAATDHAARRVALAGLDELETNELVASIAGRPPSRRLLQLIRDAADGNPLATRVLVQGLLDDGRVATTARELRLVGDWVAPPGRSVDTGLRDTLGRVSTDCRALLVQAAVLGAEGDLAELEAVAGLDAARFDALLDEAATHGLLVDDGARYRFGHPQIHRLVYREPRLRRRQELHRLVADRLERLAEHGGRRRDPGRDLRIAHHLREAGDAAQPERVAQAALAAADHAFALAAWADAASYYETALDRLDRLGPGDATTAPPAGAGDGAGGAGVADAADLHHRAGLAHFRNHDVESATAHLEQAVAAAREAGDLRRWGTSVLVLLRARMAYGGGLSGAQAEPAPLIEFLDAAGDREPELRARALAQLAELAFERFDLERGMTLGLEARGLAADADDHQLGCEIEFSIGLQHLGRLELERADRCFRASLDHARQLSDPWQQAWGLGRLPLVGWLRGHLHDADGAGLEAEELATRHHDWAEHSLASACRTGVAAAQGRFAAAEQHAAVGRQMLLRSDYYATPVLLYPALMQARAARGDRAGALAVLDDWQQQGGRGLRPYRLLVQAVAGDGAELADDLAARPWRDADPAAVDLFSCFTPAAQVELADAIADAELSRRAYECLLAMHARGVAWTPGWSLFVPRLLGVTAGLLGQRDEGEAWLAEALRIALGAGSRSEAARVRLDLARLLAAAGRAADDARARELAAEAARGFDELDMMPFLVRAHGLAETLAARTDHPGQPVGAGAVRTVLFTDIEGSTEMNVRAGDARWVELLREHDTVVRKRLREFGGVEFKHTGDGISAWFPSAAGGVLCAVRVGEDLDATNRNHPELALRVRCGLAAGTPIDEGTDLFGLTVVTASRICSLAQGGQVLVSQDVADLAKGSGRVRFDRLGRFTLKGLPDPRVVYAVHTEKPLTT